LANPEATLNQRLNACRRLIRYGEIGEATTELVRLMESKSAHPRVEALLAECREMRALQKRLGLGTRSRPEVAGADTADRGYWTIPAGSKTTILAFTGRANRLSLSIYFLQRLLQRHAVNVVFLFDWDDVYYLNGVKGLGDSIAPTVGSLRGICEDLGTERLICMGQSAGGYGALRYGLDLAADGVLAFSPTMASMVGERRWQKVAAGVGGTLQRDDVDVGRLYAAAGSAGTPVVQVVYGAGNRADRLIAEHLGALPKVKGLPLSGVSSHGTMKDLVVSGQFSSLFVNFCREAGAPID
jgi:hypothetical protein